MEHAIVLILVSSLSTKTAMGTFQTLTLALAIIAPEADQAVDEAAGGTRWQVIVVSCLGVLAGAWIARRQIRSMQAKD